HRQALARGPRLRLVEGDDRVSDARPERRPQARLGRLRQHRQPQHPRVAGICAQGRGCRGRDAHAGGGCARRGAPSEWKVPVSEVSASNSVITHKPSGRTTTYGKVAEAAAKIEPPSDLTLKDPKDWKIC